MKTKIGTVFEITTNNHYVYGVYALEHELGGSLLKLVQHRYVNKVENPEDLFSDIRLYHNLFSVAHLFLQIREVRIVGLIRLSEKLKQFPLFRWGIIAPEIGLNQEQKIYDGEKSYPATHFPNVNVNLLPEFASLPKGEILRIVNDFPTVE